MIHSYPQVFQLGHKAVGELLADPVVVQEKVDGSQFSFGMIDGKLECRSKGQQIIMDGPDGMFDKAIATAQALAPLLRPDWVYRAEYLQKPKHNVIAYERTPVGNLILYDINLTGGTEEVYADMALLLSEAQRLGLDSVPLLLEGGVSSAAPLQELLEHDSVLGGTKVEGIVIKNYAKFGGDKKVLMGKLVRADFQEKHQGEWRAANPGSADVIADTTTALRTEARWRKAVQHLREASALKQAPEDIGPLMKEVQADVLKEEGQAIKDSLFAWAWPHIRRGLVAGLPEWYKGELLRAAMPDEVKP
jgi:hypothetical protein